MGSFPQEEEKALLVIENPPKTNKGGLRAIPFIIVNESLERLASTGLLPNMVFYLGNEYHIEVATVSVIISLWSALSNGLSIFGAVIADSYFGRFPIIVVGSSLIFLGMTMLWLTAMFPQLRPFPCDEIDKYSCNYSPSSSQLAFLLSSFAIISIGAGCNRACSQAFGLDQLDNRENSNNERILQTFINWYGVSIAFASVLALTVVVYIQDQFGWQIGFGVPTVLTLFSVLIILLGSPMYIKAKATKSLFVGLFQVVVAAFKNRNLSLPPMIHNGRDNYHQTHEPKILAPSENLRWLNKACVIKDPERELNPDGSASDPWSLCTVEQVESLKALLRVVPIWSTGIMLIVSMNQSSFSTLQAKSMDRRIISNFDMPAGSFGVIMVATLVVWLSFYDRAMIPLLARLTGDPRGLTSKARMAISLVLSCTSMAVSAAVESTRRKMVIEQGFEDDPYAKVGMSALWLVPQYIIMGMSEAFHGTSQAEFFYLQLPKEMSCIALSLYTLELAGASLVGCVLVKVVDWVTSRGGEISWLASNINKGHLDYFYWLLACLCSVNVFYFLICLRDYEPSNHESTSNQSDEVEDGECH
ncbi:protein NRT1/ PTR FAMILY 1.2-like [Actinidia eriantha]|uniref:protein NRT1/ PTR FAMILY 1.2-like n=1 Tax=Actinidia eriantha TaxID=165200 RepID=UPI0025910445|nr:protein NRT1/ PTR FAMILY 1.2-like [Actinidia eriantha]